MVRENRESGGTIEEFRNRWIESSWVDRITLFAFSSVVAKGVEVFLLMRAQNCMHLTVPFDFPPLSSRG